MDRNAFHQLRLLRTHATRKLPGMGHNLTVELLEKRPGKGIQPGVRSCRTAVLSVLLQDNPHSSCPLHAMIYPVLSQWVVSPCHPPSFQLLSLCSLQQNNLPSSSCTWLTRSWRQGCDVKCCQPKPVPPIHKSLRSCIPSPPREQRGQGFSSCSDNALTLIGTSITHFHFCFCREG